MGIRITEQDRFLDKPIIIVGAPRSGTTMMGRILSRHPNLKYFQEPRLIWRYGNDGKSDMLRPADARPEVVKHVRNSFGRAVRDAGKCRMLEKTPSTGLRMGFVDRVMPDCKFVHIIRDGTSASFAIRDLWQRHAHGLSGLATGRIRQRLGEVSLSRLPYYGVEVLRRVAPGPLRRAVGQNVWGPRIPGLQEMVRDLDLLEVCTTQWRTCVEQACIYGRSLSPDRYMELRLEELGPQAIETVLDFCELSPSQDILDYINDTFRADRPQRRIDEADPDELERVRQWVAPTMTWLKRESMVLSAG